MSFFRRARRTLNDASKVIAGASIPIVSQVAQGIDLAIRDAPRTTAALATAPQTMVDAMGQTWRYDPLRRAWEILKDEARTYAGRVIGAAADEASRSAARATAPIAIDRSQQAVREALPWIIGGALLVLVVKGVRS